MVPARFQLAPQAAAVIKSCTLRILSLGELLRRASDWDDLWDRSGLELPLLKADFVALWVEQFSHARRFRAIAVEEDGRFVAALPLVKRRIHGPLLGWGLPTNEWTASGDLLWDAASGDESLRALAAGLSRHVRTLAWFDSVELHAQRWRRFCAALEGSRMPHDGRERYQVGVIDVARDFESYAARLSGGFRRNVRRRLRNLETRGGCQYRRVLHPTGEILESLLSTALEIERCSWKGAAGTAVVQTPGMERFFRRQAALAAANGALYLDFLDVAGRPIAFELGYICKGRQFAHKISYIEEYAAEAPGQALRWLQLQHMAAASDVRVFDNFGMLTEAAQAWCSGTYAIGRLVVGSRRLASRTIYSLLQTALPWYRSWRDQRAAKKVGAPTDFSQHAHKTGLRAAGEESVADAK